ncbi:hypothetical protein [Gracilimonas sp.]|uniref:hypothetical protein n=1 Tax=Gracilimonas sp. TaxID=1974203 RepID=UPI003D151AD6
MSQNSVIKYPLTKILGSKSHVQLIRVMILVGEPITAKKLIKRTGLSKQGVYDGIDRLNKLGVIKYVGSGKQIELRKKHPFYKSLTQLFSYEHEYFNEILNELKRQIGELKEKPLSAWIHGNIASGQDEYGDPIEIAMLGKVKTVDSMVSEFRERMFTSGFENRFDVTLEIKGVTSADKDQLLEKDKILLFGTDPAFYINDVDKNLDSKSHQEHDDSSLYNANHWLDFLKTHPEIIERTKMHLKERVDSEKSGIKNELVEWYRLLESMSFQRLKKLMQSDSERSTRLRQSLPFWPVLTEAERKEFISRAE